MKTVFPWLTSKTNIDYPFTARRDDGFHALFTDAYVIHTKLRDKDQLLKITSFDPAGSMTLKFADDVVLEAFTPSDGFISKVFGSFTLYEWRKSVSTGAGLFDRDIVARVTVLTENLSEFSFPAALTDAFLQPSLVNPSMSRIRRIGTAINGVACCIAVSDKNVILEAGNNVKIELKEEAEIIQAEITTPTEEVRVPTTIRLSAIPGEGTGRFPTCTSLESEIRRIGGAGGDDNGNVFLDLGGCVWPELRLDGPTDPPIHPYTDYLATLEEALIQLHADCKACCDCPDYGAAYSRLSDAYSRAKDVAARIETVRVGYQDLVDDVETLTLERETGVTIKLRVQVGPDFSLAILGTIGNNSCDDQEGITFKFTVPTIAAAYIPASGRMEAEGFHDIQLDPVIATVGSNNTYTFSIPTVKKAKYARTRFSVRVGPIAGTNRAGLVQTLTAEAIQNAAVVASDEVIVTLKGPLDKS